MDGELREGREGKGLLGWRRGEEVGWHWGGGGRGEGSWERGKKVGTTIHFWHPSACLPAWVPASYTSLMSLFALSSLGSLRLLAE